MMNMIRSNTVVCLGNVTQHYSFFLLHTRIHVILYFRSIDRNSLPTYFEPRANHQFDGFDETEPQSRKSKNKYGDDWTV